MHKKLVFATIIGLLLLSLACTGGGTKTPEPVVTTEPPVKTEPPAAGGFTITVKNQSPYDICYVYISASDQESWGDSWLDGKIASGKSKAFQVDTAGEYDVMVRDCDDIPVQTAWQLSADETVTVGGAGKTALMLKNDSSTEVCYVFISPSGNDNWGDDWLGAKESIAAQGGQRIFYLDPGTYDLLAQDCDQQDLVQEQGVDISKETTWTLSD